MNWFRNIEDIKSILQSISVWDQERGEIDPNMAFIQWESCTQRVRAAKRTVYLIGNGASASMASHVAADLAKNAHVHTEVFSDLSLITALANDLGYEEVFAEPLRRRMKEGDMLVAISSSGKSLNIIRACQQAVKRGGTVITLSAMDSDNPLRSHGILNFYLPAKSYGMAETGHAAILHYWLDQMILESLTAREGKPSEEQRNHRKAATSWVR